MKYLLLVPTLFCMTISNTESASRAYIAAAYDHARYGWLTDPPGVIVDRNLRKYMKAAEIALSKGADIIVYPEYGIFYPGNRTQLKSFLEDIPDPKKLKVNPCEVSKRFLKTPILLTLSCIAKNNSMYVVANTGEIQNCFEEPDCPEDGVFHFNTNVVFDRNGNLILKYHKEHLFFERGMDLARKEQDPIFNTDFGTFATFINFDIVFKRMSDVAKRSQVDGVMLSSLWAENPPLGISVPYWQGWALGNNATLVVSNIQSPNLHSVGSGIFHKTHGFLGYTYNPDTVSKVVVTKVPVAHQPVPFAKASVTAFTDTKVWNWRHDGENVPNTCSNYLVKTETPESFACFDENASNYTLVKLTESRGRVEACNNDMCCSLSYDAENMEEDFYLGIKNGTLNAFNKYSWCEENCFLAKCDTVEGRPCSTFPRRASTVFHHVQLKANFSTPFIYPSVVSSKTRLVPMTEWDFNVRQQKSYFESSIHFHSEQGKHLLLVGFTSRCYDRDPPYIR